MTSRISYSTNMLNDEFDTIIANEELLNLEGDTRLSALHSLIINLLARKYIWGLVKFIQFKL